MNRRPAEWRDRREIEHQTPLTELSGDEIRQRMFDRFKSWGMLPPETKLLPDGSIEV
jgi:hypothetical protein